MLQPHAALALAAALLLGGCEAIYDDTKGWASRLEASILDAAHDASDETESPGAETAALTRIPRPEGTPMPIAPDLADELRQDDLLLDELPAPDKPAPNKEAGIGEVTTAAAELVNPEETTQEAVSASDGESKPAKADLPPRPQRKPEQATTQTAVAKAEAEAEPKRDPEVEMVLHLSSLRSEAAARREWSDLRRRFPEPLGAMQAEFRRTEMGDKGIFYRVLAGPLPSKAAASQACAALKAKSAKQYCRVMPPKPKS